MKLLWLLSALGSLAAVGVMVGLFPQADSAPKEAVICCLALVVAVVPYVLARSAGEIAADMRREVEQRRNEG